MTKTLLQEYITPVKSNAIIESVDSPNGKTWTMKGIFIEGDVKNANERVYPRDEIRRAVSTLMEQIKRDIPVLGEIDHPDDLKINLDRVSHVITDMYVEGPNGIGTLKIIPTPMGNTIGAMLGAGVKLGVSSRGSGNVDDMNGRVSDFEICTVDIVAQPSAPNAYPKAIYEGLMNHRGGQRLLTMYGDPAKSPRAQQFVANELIKFIKDLKIR